MCITCALHTFRRAQWFFALFSCLRQHVVSGSAVAATAAMHGRHRCQRTPCNNKWRQQQKTKITLNKLWLRACEVLYTLRRARHCFWRPYVALTVHALVVASHYSITIRGKFNCKWWLKHFFVYYKILNNFLQFFICVLCTRNSIAWLRVFTFYRCMRHRRVAFAFST